MAEPTKVPWKAVIGECAQVRDAENALVATFHHINADGCRRDAGDVANAARLTAAAPELLEALKRVMANGAFHTSSFEQAKAAIAKAEAKL